MCFVIVHFLATASSLTRAALAEGRVARRSPPVHDRPRGTRVGRCVGGEGCSGECRFCSLARGLLSPLVPVRLVSSVPPLCPGRDGERGTGGGRDFEGGGWQQVVHTVRWGAVSSGFALHVSHTHTPPCDRRVPRDGFPLTPLALPSLLATVHLIRCCGGGGGGDAFSHVALTSLLAPLGLLLIDRQTTHTHTHRVAPPWRWR